MKWIGGFAIACGVVMLLRLLMAPVYLVYTAPSYGVIMTWPMMLDMARFMWASLLLEVLFAIVCMLLGSLIWQKKTLGFTLWTLLCAYSIVSAIVSLFIADNHLYDGFSLVLWCVTLGISLWVSKRPHAAQYWSA